jgi:hypothetical protein
LHLCHKSKKEMVILKLDFEKVFDKIEHEVILQILEKKGFLKIWNTCIRNILSSGTSSVLLNGTQGKSFIVGEETGKVILCLPSCLS